MKRSPVLITGVAGFIGSNLARALLKAGRPVVGLDNLSQGTALNLEEFRNDPSFRFVEGDVRDTAAIVKAAEGCGAIYHLAAYKIPRYGNAYDTLDTNVRGTQSAVEAAVRHGAQLVFSSTSDVYGRNPNLPFTEDHDLVLGPPDVRRWAYAVSKAFDEQLLFAEKERRNLRFTIVRFFGGYGPNQNLTWWGGPQSVFISHALDGTPMPVHGDGSQSRSFTYVEDHVDGLMRCLDNGNALGEVFNLGSQEEITILELARKIWSIARPGTEPKVELVPYQTFGKYTDVTRRLPDLAKSRRILGYEPKWSLDRGLRITIEWQRRRRQRLNEAEKAPSAA